MRIPTFPSLIALLAIPLLLNACRPVQAPASSSTPAAGATKTNPKDGAVYVYVSAGPFMMGSAADDTDALSDEKPQTEVTTEGFWIMRTEVTNAQYMRCVAEKACSELHTTVWQDPKYADYPVSMVTWKQANDYAKWVGGRLPTEAEWEKVCRGPDGRTFPWGNQAPTAEVANIAPSAEAKPVGSFPSGASPYGALDMAGNLSEWTSSKYMDYPYRADDGREVATGNENRVVRGSSFEDTAAYVRCAFRAGVIGEEYVAFPVLGFRVVSSAP